MREPTARPARGRTTQWWLPPQRSSKAARSDPGEPGEGNRGTARWRPTPSRRGTARGRATRWWSPPSKAGTCHQREAARWRPTPSRRRTARGRATRWWPPQAKQEHARRSPPSHATTTDPLTGLITFIAKQLHAYRQDHKQQQPTNLKAIATWNVGGWTQPGKAGDEKLRAIKASLMRGPVALQETHWSEEQATKVTTLIPGARAVATPATIKNTTQAVESQ